MMKPFDRATFVVDWTKTYIHSGSLNVVADSQEDAENIVREAIGDLVGSSQYDPDQDTVTAIFKTD